MIHSSDSESEEESAPRKKATQFAQTLEKVSAVISELQKQAPLLSKGSKKSKSKKRKSASGDDSEPKKKKKKDEEQSKKRKQQETEDDDNSNPEKRTRVDPKDLNVTFDPREKNENVLQIVLDDEQDNVVLQSPENDFREEYQDNRQTGRTTNTGLPAAEARR